MRQLNQQQKFEEEAYLWFTSRAVSQEQYQYFRDIYAPMLIPEEADDIDMLFEKEPDAKATAVQFRITL
ncbi:MAG: hypothetical protein IK125_08345, partial [Lachnospiraceae bacterium]|nr:hypothetical protein [Lachnospiraceae bacterium]